MPLLAVMSDLDLIESPSADQARSCLKLVFAASHTMIFERLPRKMYLCNAKAVVHSCCIFAKECLKVYSWLLSRHSLTAAIQHCGMSWSCLTPLRRRFISQISVRLKSTGSAIAGCLPLFLPLKDIKCWACISA